jgi:hypothetical protein
MMEIRVCGEWLPFEYGFCTALEEGTLDLLSDDGFEPENNRGPLLALSYLKSSLSFIDLKDKPALLRGSRILTCLALGVITHGLLCPVVILDRR